MVKRLRISGKDKALKKNIKPPSRGVFSKDRLSELPSEILVDILSKLKTKEAGRTSILSRRWRYMWPSVSNLDFDGSEVLDDLGREIKHLEEEEPIYVSCVNQAIKRHQGQAIDQFVVVFSLDESSGSDIDNWVNFGLRKKVQRLKLDLRDYYLRSQQNKPYNFPDSLEIPSCSPLTSLHLDEVNITGKMLELFIHSCLNLERVFVKGSVTLLSLNVDEQTLKLKWLDLHCCHNIKCLNVSAPNLVSFNYTGPPIPMPLKNAPKLREISVQGRYSKYLTSRLSELSRYFTQLEKLKLDAFVVARHVREARSPVFLKLKHLTLSVGFVGPQGILDYASMINACPSLHSFSFQNQTRFNFCTGRRLTETYPRHNNIRVVEFSGFLGKGGDIEIAIYLIENAVKLEKITFDATNPGNKGCWLEVEEESGEMEIAARACARELGKRLPPSVELVIV